MLPTLSATCQLYEYHFFTRPEYTFLVSDDRTHLLIVYLTDNCHELLSVHYQVEHQSLCFSYISDVVQLSIAGKNIYVDQQKNVYLY